MLTVETFELPPIGTNAYFVHNRARAEAVVVDAPLNTFATIEKRLVETGAKLAGLLMTHGHWDHTLDGWRFSEAGTPTYGHPDDRELFETPKLMAMFAPPELLMRPTTIKQWLRGGEEIELLGTSVEIRHVPGHCPGSLLFWFRDAGIAFVGDAIFQGGIGRADLPGGHFPTLEQSIRNQIYTLPAETELFPGHGGSTTVERERANNPFVRPE